MKLRYLTVLIMGLLATPVYAEKAHPSPARQPAAKTQTTLNELDKLSYSFGQNIGRGFKQQEITLNLNIFLKGIQDALSNNKPLLNPQEMGQVMTDFQKKRVAGQKTLADKNLKEGKAFLVTNESKQGVVTLPSGLQYKVLKQGTGKTPQATDKVTIHYRGTLIDGTEFDNSYQRRQPAIFPVTKAIKGWTEALQLMKEGAKWQLFIPSELAYGAKGVGGKVGPNATLIYEIELVSVTEFTKVR